MVDWVWFISLVMVVDFSTALAHTTRWPADIIECDPPLQHTTSYFYHTPFPPVHHLFLLNPVIFPSSLSHTFCQLLISFPYSSFYPYFIVLRIYQSFLFPSPPNPSSPPLHVTVPPSNILISNSFPAALPPPRPTNTPRHAH